jgi:hypothetical protein
MREKRNVAPVVAELEALIALCNKPLEEMTEQELERAIAATMPEELKDLA